MMMTWENVLMVLVALVAYMVYFLVAHNVRILVARLVAWIRTKKS